MSKYSFLLILPLCFSFSQQKSSWEIWIGPATYTVDIGDTLHLSYGVSGYGPLDPTNIKIAVYSDTSTSIVSGGQRFDTFVFAPIDRADRKDRFTKRHPTCLPYQKVLVSDYESHFDPLVLVPRTSGDKRVLLIATYSPGSIFWYTTSREFNYHVNSYIEKWQTELAVVGLFLALFAIGPLNDFYAFLKNQFKHIYTSMRKERGKRNA